MELMRDSWYIIIPVIVAAMFILGYRPKTNQSEEVCDVEHRDANRKKCGSGDRCCH